MRRNQRRQVEAMAMGVFPLVRQREKGARILLGNVAWEEDEQDKCWCV